MKKTTEQKMGKWEPSGEKKIEKKPKKKRLGDKKTNIIDQKIGEYTQFLS